MSSDLAVPRLAVTIRNSGRAHVSYHGVGHAPAEETYTGIDPLRIMYTTRDDAGVRLDTRAELRALYPLIAAAVYEAAFCAEAGPLLTWLN